MVLVKWVDSASRSRWEMLEDAETLTVMDCTTIGTLLNRNGNAIRVAQTTDPDGAVNHTIAIPKVCVTSIIQLVELE